MIYFNDSSDQSLKCSWAYKAAAIKWFESRTLIQQIKNEISSGLKKSIVDLGKFNQRGNNESRKNKNTGLSIYKYTAGHKESKLKLKDRSGRIKASLDAKGRVLGK